MTAYLLDTTLPPQRWPLPATRDDALQFFAAWQALAAQHGVALRPPPPEPVGCCGRGCNGCVWEGFYAATQFWHEDALDALTPAPTLCASP